MTLIHNMIIPALLTQTLLLLTVIAAPAETNPTNATLSKRAEVGIYICSAPNFTGNCHHHIINSPNDNRSNYKKCMMLLHSGGIACFGPDRGIIVNVFSDKDCTHLSMPGNTYPGWPALYPFKDAEGRSIQGRSPLFFYVEDDEGGKVKVTKTPTGKLPAGTGIW